MSDTLATCWSLAHLIVADRTAATEIVSAGVADCRGNGVLTATHHRAVLHMREPERREHRPTVAELRRQLLTTEGAAERQVGVALAGLPSPECDAIVLAYFGGYTLDEIASLTHVGRSVVGARLRNGLDRLAEALVHPDGDAPAGVP